jgi:hypothetical protein
MDWDFNKSNKLSNDSLLGKAISEGSKMERDAIQWINDKILPVISKEIMSATSERERSSIVSAIPMMTVAAIITFVNIAAKPDVKHKLMAKSLMLKAALDFTRDHLEKIDREVKNLSTDKDDKSASEEEKMFDSIRESMDDISKMPLDKWMEKYSDLIKKVEETNQSIFKNRSGSK